ncbi:ammonium transporter [Lacrimispora algidixylanolytica]|uniref:Adenylate cyclase n=1 Tax=Lacrimispora algidixylanolytica TaxID=94868 RepID=A0A419T7T2_9FIRM|nr:ammonium transporter [Lacrimispora algidixylanolytica]RKD33541.1 adenylate cyclase [Lacrimispora algidixylanolytica]
MNVNDILTQANANMFSIWFLIGAAFVFFMQAGFAMVETGFTRAKNAGNIIMKNLMDFCIGTVVFLFLGFGLMMAEDTVMGLVGIPNLDLFTNFAEFNWSSFVFNLVFCATAATIVSGSMAERTKFSAYLIYSAVISAVIYPIEAGWIWNGGGWLFNIGYVDFAGSSAIHMVGGLSAFIGAAILGPRLGKYTKDKNGKTLVHAIPGHSITLGALGVFILWFGWYGFNGAACTSVEQLAQVFGTTTISAGFATVTTMLFTWFKNGKPDVSMTLNGSLAGLVAITAPCANVDALGAVIIGIVGGFLVVLAVEFIDMKLHVDDPVGAVAVHCANGIWGTLAVGLFGIYDTGSVTKGLFYGGGFRQLGIQLLGVICILLWTAVTITITFIIIKRTVGLRVSAEEEMEGLDIKEHGLSSSYADFMPAGNMYYTAGNSIIPSAAASTFGESSIPAESVAPAPVLDMNKDVPVSGNKISKVTIITRQDKLEELKTEMNQIEVTGMTVTQVMGYGIQKGQKQVYRGVPVEINLLPKVQVDIVVSKVPVSEVLNAAKRALYTGKIGDGKIFVYTVDDVFKVRTGENGYDALQDEG